MHPRRHSTVAIAVKPAPDLPVTVERARAGDQAALRDLIELYQHRVARFVRSMLRDDDEWEDVAQCAFARMILGIDHLASVETFESWLFRIARNASLDHLRRRRWRSIFIPWEPRHGEVAAPATGFNDPRLPQIERALDELPKDQCELILLMRERDWTYGDLARITGTSPSTVKARLFRARSRLRRLLNEVK
jgi:RNA polymerase sigma-70 factor, ECF subfamily